MHRLPVAQPFRVAAFTTLAALSFALACDERFHTREAEKPSGPLEITIVPGGEIRRGEVGEFTVTVSILAESSDFALDVELPREVALYSGDLHQRGPVHANTRFKLVFAVRVPAEGSSVISATARLRVGEAGAFSASATYPIPAAPAHPTTPDRGVSVTRAGESLREYRLP